MDFVENLEGLLSSKVEIAKSFWSLLKLESRLAGLSVFPLLTNLAMFAGLFITVWLSFMVLIGYGIVSLTQQYLLAILSIFFINGSLLLYVAKRMHTCIKHMSFEKTRSYLNTSHPGDRHELKEEAATVHRKDRKAVTFRPKKSRKS